jgi:hypothetical protein
VIHQVPKTPPQPREQRPQPPRQTVMKPDTDPVMGNLLPSKEPMDPAMKPDPMPKPVEPMPKPPEPMPEPVPTPKPPEPAPKPPEPAKPLPSKQQVTELAKALAKARLELSEGNVEEAKLTMAAVEKLPKLPEHEAMFGRMTMLVDYNGQFWHAIDEAVKTFKDGMNSELMVGSQVILVVEAFPDKIILRIAGQNKTYSLKTLPGGIAVAIADKWLKPEDPASKVMKGAYAAVNKAGNVEKAKTMWEEAIAGGVDVKALVPVIDDKYDGLEKDLEKAMSQKE